MVDLGCGPGLYAYAFTEKGYSVTGIDISPLSIAYAKKWAKLEKKRIEFKCNDYLSTGIDGKYDIALCIYCDFGALIPREQKVFLENVYRALDKEGLFVFDVFGKGLCKNKKEYRKWDYEARKDFWSARSHYLLQESVHFKDQKAWGNRTIVIEAKKKPKEYITWDRYFDEDEIIEFLGANGFKVEEIKKNLVSKNEFTSNDVLFIKARKMCQRGVFDA